LHITEAGWLLRASAADRQCCCRLDRCLLINIAFNLNAVMTGSTSVTCSGDAVVVLLLPGQLQAEQWCGQ
jgi:hypothetical protein